MSEFINRIKQLGDDVLSDSIIDGAITEIDLPNVIRVDGSEHYNRTAQTTAKVRSLLESPMFCNWSTYASQSHDETKK